MMQPQRFIPEPPVSTFRVRMLGCAAEYAPENAREIQREIEIAANNTLGDLGFAILDAYNFGSDHLWSFFLSGKAWDKTTEYAYHAGDWDDDEDDDIEDVVDLFPEGSEMRKLAQLAEDPAFEATEALPAEIDRAKLQAEMVAMLNEAAAEAPAEDRALIAEFARLIESDPNADPAKMSEALQRYLFGDWQPDDEGETSDSESALAAALFSPDLAGLGLPFLSDFDEAPDVDDILIRDLPYPSKTGKKEFLFIFDYGDEWEFGVKLLDAKGKLTPNAEYPRLTASRGDAPPQYPPWDEDDEEWDDEEEGDEDDTPRTGTLLHLDPKTGQVTREIIAMPPKKKR
jgi:hypothetical protein